MKLNFQRRFDEKNLPDLKTLLSNANKIAQKTVIGESLFMKTHHVRSEAEYKRKMMSQNHGHIMKHSHIGWNSLSFTMEGFHKIYDELLISGSYVDRFGVCLDGTMGLPEKYRDRMQVGSGQIYKTPDEWKLLSQQVPVQIHMGDHMIGSLNAVENTINALSAGVTTIGNISHYFSYEYPGFDIEEQRTIDYITAIGIMGFFRKQGTIIHSNLDDGFGAQFHDLANLAGWAKLERYVVEKLIGAGMAHCFGNLFSDPILRIVFSKAMWDINTFKTPGSMIYGNTTDFGINIPKNYGALSSFSLADIMGQIKWPTGHAVTAIPVTEAIRVPSPEEIIDAEHVLDIMIEKAGNFAEVINFQVIEERARTLNVAGNTFFERIINALDDIGVDINHPGQIVAVLKAIGAEQMEINFGAGKKDSKTVNRIAVWPTDTVRTVDNIQRETLEKIHGLEKKPLKGINLVIGCTDIHVFGKEIVKRIIEKAGANVYDLGDATSVKEFADTLLETESKILMISTYNGLAYSYAKDMIAELKAKGMNDVKIIMGGRLNETMEASDIPEDVSKELSDMGIDVSNNAETICETIIKLYNS